MSGTKKTIKPQLRVVFDTNALYVPSTNTGSASDLVRQELVELISEPKYPDLDILWYLPSVVRHERQYQMQQEALRLRGSIDRIERLLGHNLALTDQVLLDHVNAKINAKKQELGLTEIELDHGSVDWSGLIRAAVYRLAPFQGGEKEKGFRDALVAESFLQLAASAPKSPRLCRLVLVTSDELLSLAVKERLSNSSNASILGSIEDLRGLINTLVSNVGEDFIAQLKPKASQIFFISSEAKEALYFKEKIGERLREQFKTQMDSRPEGTEFRANGTWYINNPNFSRKEGRRIYWTTRIDIGTEAGVMTKEPEENLFARTLLAPLSQKPSASAGLNLSPSAASYWTELAGSYRYSVPLPLTGLGEWHRDPSTLQVFSGNAGKRVITHKGQDRYEVLWSTEVTQARALRRIEINDIRHIELVWQPISSPSG